MAVNSITIAPAKQTTLRRVIGGSPAAHGGRTDAADEVDVGPDQQHDEDEHLGMPDGSAHGLGTRLSLPTPQSARRAEAT